MNNKSSTVGLIVVAIIAIIALVAAFKTEGAPGPQGPRGVQGEQGLSGKDGRNGIDGVTTIKTVNPSPVFGAVVGPDFYGEYTAVNDVQSFHRKVGRMNTATTTACAIQSPRTGTTTLKHFLANFLTSSTSASHIQLGRSATMNATTTVLASIGVAADSGVQLAATTSLTTNNAILAPGTWLNVKMSTEVGTASNGTFSPTGSCSAIFVGI